MPGPMRVVQCWDDGCHDDIRLCSILRKHGAKATFNLNPGLHPRRSGARPALDLGGRPTDRMALADMPAIYHGFTIANHSMTHPWPSRIPLEAWRQEVVDARAILQDVFQQPVDGFAYPFGDVTDEAAEVVRAAGHRYARTCETRTPFSLPCDPMRLPTDGHHRDPAFWRRYETAKASGSHFYFWGHSWELGQGDLWDEFDGVIARIASDPDVVFADITDIITAG